ncbi:glucose-6-phosphate isomerase family protein [Kaistia nematophila]|uniref:glucose-6-phosphate isomerase n=1 Tax=Kaistia nematophila TaxID=2994654 RepID=A0A9X3E570_9HYPH|nr:glucose-6-phosphate isomerase family protein [Kaistia nematophila]MCX5569908.1 glucose-6-phosphate isomerase [Kaistia nematophila]
MAIAPTSHRIDPQSGVLSAATGRYEKRLADLDGIYADNAAFAESVAREGDRVVYYVHEVRPVAARGDLIFGTTFMEPGRIGDEFFVTRGHIHAIGNRPETYYGEAGEGLMLLESPEGETQILEIAPRVMVYVPPLWIHRSVNTGAAPLVMSFCYPSDSGQDYGLIARSGGMATRIVADGAGWKAVPNAAYRPRSKAEIDAILATQD